MEAAKGVDAPSALAEAWKFLALINIYHREKTNRKKKNSIRVYVSVSVFMYDSEMSVREVPREQLHTHLPG